MGCVSCQGSRPQGSYADRSDEPALTVRDWRVPARSGSSALLLCKPKDNNASCAIGPIIRLFDGHFGLDQLRRETVHPNVSDVCTLRGICGHQCTRQG